MVLSGIIYGQAPAQQAPPVAAPAPAPAAQASPESNASSQVVHILVGHSVLIRTEARLKRVLVGNPAVVTTTTTSANELVVTANATGSSSVILWQEDNSSRIVEVFADLDVSLLREAVQQAFPTEGIQVEAEEGRIALNGMASSPAVADQVAKMAAPFSKDIVNSIRVALPGRKKQILLKVRFAEIDRTKMTQFGINILSTGGANTVGAVTTQQFGAPGLGAGAKLTGQIGAPTKGFESNFSVSDILNIFVFRPDLNLGATIRDLQQRNVLQILAEPNLMAASGESASFLAGGELPFPVVTGAAGQSTVNIQFKPFGVKLEFTGTIENDGIIRLKVFPEVSSLDFTNAVTISGFLEPAFSTRHAETTVELKDGQSFGIAGLLDQRTTVLLSKVPGIGDIPILGQLFRSRQVTKANTELMVIVTPTIVDPTAATTPAAEIPKMPAAPLDPTKFDKKVPKGNGNN